MAAAVIGGRGRGSAVHGLSWARPALRGGRPWRRRPLRAPCGHTSAGRFTSPVPRGRRRFIISVFRRRRPLERGQRIIPMGIMDGCLQCPVALSQSVHHRKPVGQFVVSSVVPYPPVLNLGPGVCQPGVRVQPPLAAGGLLHGEYLGDPRPLNSVSVGVSVGVEFGMDGLRGSVIGSQEGLAYDGRANVASCGHSRCQFLHVLTTTGQTQPDATKSTDQTQLRVLHQYLSNKNSAAFVSGNSSILGKQK